MLRCFERVGTDNLFVNLDTANLIMYGKANPVDSIRKFHTRIYDMHIKNVKFDPVKKEIIGDAEANALLKGAPNTPRKGWEEFYRI